MIDVEVMRLRRLRITVLKARALAAALGSSSSRHDSASRHDSTFSRTAVSCWQIARVVTGRLRAHPYLSYQRGPSELSAVYAKFRANLLGSAARYGQRSLRTLSKELQNVARELDDARALTWSAELSDTFGRSQTRIRRLLAEIDAGAYEEAGSRKGADSRNAMIPQVEAQASAAQEGARNLTGNWPYLAF